MRVAVVERQGVIPARAVTPRAHPLRIRQRLQVPADGRLRQLDDGAELRHGQLLPFEDQQHPSAGRVRERGEVVKDGWSIHPYIRINSLTLATGRCQRGGWVLGVGGWR